MSHENDKSKRSGWLWVPSLYYAEGIPYIIVMMASVAMYKMLGVSNAKFAFWTSLLYLPWVVKPLWSPVVEVISRKRNWIVFAQFLIGILFFLIAFSLNLSIFFTVTIIIFWFMAFSSATHDIAADGFYMLGLTEKKQSFFVGIRSTFYRFAMMTGQGLLLILVGLIETNTGLPSQDIPVISNPEQQIEQKIKINARHNIKVQNGDLRIISVPDTIYISTQKAKPAYIDSMITKARQINIKNGHIEKIKKKKNNSENPKKQAGLDKFELFIKNTFGEHLEKRAAAGNIGFVYLHLSKPPKKRNIGVNFGREKGNQSISLVHGEHFKFNQDNWNQPAIAVIQLHPNLNKKTKAVFISRAGNTELAWSVVFIFMGILFLLLCLYHRFILPYPRSDQSRNKEKNANFIAEFIDTFKTFFKKDNIGLFVAFLLLFRLSESQLVKLAQPFLLDAQEAGGLALTASEVGIAYGTVGIIMLTLGGLIGGFLASKFGLRKLLLWMTLAINIPNAVYIYMAYLQPDSFLTINFCVGLEQFGYGFGFAAYMLTQIYIAEGEYKTAHFALTTAFMALGMMIPGMWTGWLQELIGYKHFFIWVMICIIPIFAILPMIIKKIDPEFGLKEE
ncbi:MAG: MFS transporter [Candidatus Marinimicrobia bacterium]|nr:MFS transporter [Candidatus Neomarinimicrobiota bacterium]